MIERREQMIRNLRKGEREEGKRRGRKVGRKEERKEGRKGRGEEGR